MDRDTRASTGAKERWLPVVGYHGYYEVSDHGRVRTVTRKILFKNGARRVYIGRMLSTAALVSGYRSVSLWAENRGERVLVHRLVLETFVGPCPAGMECRHEDGDRLNARLTNLSWGTPKQNGEDRVGHGKQARHERHGMAKLTADNVRTICGLLGTMPQREIAAMFNVDPSLISRLNTGDRDMWAGVRTSPAK